MARRGRRRAPNRRTLLALTLLVAWWPVAAPGAGGEELELVGLVTRDELEALLPDWIEAQLEAQPDVEAAVALAEALPGKRVTVFLGTWCSDSRRELGRLWRALDDAGVGSPPELDYVAVDRAKQEPAGSLDGIDLRFVPTFVVFDSSGEVGRVVEISPGGIERDLLALVTGRRRGLITGNEELLAEQESH